MKASTQNIRLGRLAGMVLCMISLAMLMVSVARATDRALLIGVAKYPFLNIRELPGVDIDLEIMEKIARLWGFEQIVTLRHEGATLARVEKQIDDWLIKGTSATDRVLIYFSGHGSQIPDEDGDETNDHADEVLMMYDAQRATHSGHESLTNVLVDDHFSQRLAAIPSRRVLVLVDACHSGTMHKDLRFDTTSRLAADGESGLVAKFYAYPGMSGGGSKAGSGFTETGSWRENPESNFVLIAAAGDDETSVATLRGSFFTLGVQHAVDQAGPTGASTLTPVQLKEKAEMFIADNTSSRTRYHPQLHGNARLATVALNQNVPFLPDGKGTPSGTEHWRRLEVLAEKLRSLNIKTNGGRFRSGEELNISVEVPASGSLHVFYVDERDEPRLIFPNTYHEKNWVNPGTFRIPGDMKFKLPASGSGRNLLLAIWSPRKISLLQAGYQKDSPEVFARISIPEISKAFEPRPTQRPEEAAGKIIVEIGE